MSTTTHVMRLSGDCTITGASSQHETMLAQWAELSQNDLSGGLHVNLSEVTDFDSAGVQLLLALKRSGIEAGAPIVLEQPSEAVKMALATYCLSPLDLSPIPSNQGAAA
ncbi:MAG: STAS domain-containing protein [Burkholderiaceae bacterium]